MVDSFCFVVSTNLSTFDIRAFRNGAIGFSFASGGYWQLNCGFQLTWFSGSSRNTEGSYTETIPWNVGTILEVLISTYQVGSTFGSNGDSWFQLLGFTGTSITFAYQQAHNTTGVPCVPAFLIISNNTGPAE